MKLKKSSILLIVIAIFLLISIGSVCASENITDNSDVELADDGTDVVLSNTDTDDNVADDTTQEKINTTIETEKEKYEFKQDSNKNFSVTVKNNKTGNPINVNNNDLKIFKGNESISFEYTSSIITITEALPVGNHTLTISYLGNETYINSTKEIRVGIYGNNTIETETSVVCNGKDIEIPVTINNGLKDITDLIKGNFNLTLVYTNETGNVSNMTITDFNIENGKIKFSTNVTFIAANLTIDYINATEPKTVIIKVSTEVQANVNKDKFESEEIKNISIKILDGQGNLLNISKNDLKVFDNGKEITNFKYNNSNITLNITDRGVHNITIVYKGNVTYNESTGKVVMKVYGNHTLEVPEVVVSDGNSAEIPINLTDGVDDFTKLLNSTNTNVTLKYNGTNKTVDVDWNTVKDTNKFTVTLDKIVPTTLVINYTDENGKSLIKNVAIKFSTQVQINPNIVNITEGKNATFIVTVIGANGKINITKENLTITTSVADNKFNATTGNLTLIGLTKGVYSLTITFKGNDVNNTSKANVIINVRGAAEINTNGTSVNVNSTKKGEIQIINITNGVDALDFTKDDLNLTVTYKDGNETKTIKVTEWDVVNGTIKFTLENGNFTNANLTITYNETTTKNITLNRIYNAKIIAVTTENEYKDGNFTFKLVDVDDESVILSGKSVSLYTTGNIRAGFSATTDENGIASFKNVNLYEFDQSSTSLAMNELKVGIHEVEISSSAVKAESLKTNLTVTKATINIVIDPYKEYYGSDKNVTITVTNAKSGEAVRGVILKLDMPQTSGKTYYVQTDSNGVGKISAKNLIGGDYALTVSNNDTTNINETSAKSTVTVMKIPVKIAASGLTVYYNTGATATIKVTKDGKAVSGMYLLVRLYSTSTKYNDYLFQTNSKGEVSFSASLTVGTHKMIISSADNRYDASQLTKTITVKKASAKITAKKVTDYYKGVKYFTVKLTNTKNKKAIYDAKINIKVYVSKTKYYNYNGNTGANGQIRLALDTLKPGTYKVVVSGADSKDFTAKQVTSKIVIKKAPAKLTPKKLTAKKGAKKYFKVTVKNKKTKKVIKGVKVKIKVYTGKKAKTYTAKTDAKGIAKILTNKLKVGKHKVVVTSANKYVTAKKAKSTIKIKK